MGFNSWVVLTRLTIAKPNLETRGGRLKFQTLIKIIPGSTSTR